MCQGENKREAKDSTPLPIHVAIPQQNKKLILLGKNPASSPQKSAGPTVVYSGIIQNQGLAKTFDPCMHARFSLGAAGERATPLNFFRDAHLSQKLGVENTLVTVIVLLNIS